MSTNSPSTNGTVGSTAYGTNQGARAVPQIIHSLCQYQTTSTDQQVTPCPNVAVFNPGYKRACAAHVLHILIQTINEYTHRFDAATTPSTHKISAHDLARHKEENQTLAALSIKLTKLVAATDKQKAKTNA